MSSGYYRYPTIQGEQIAFVSEDDIWAVPASGGVARRLTSNLGNVTYPFYSPDGSQLAFVGREEGYPEVYVMPAQGGPAQRLTYQSSDCRIIGWSNDGGEILYTSHHGQAHKSDYVIYAIPADGTGTARLLPIGPARAISFGPNGASVLGRNTGDPARWKRYRGGTAGHLWLDANGDGDYAPFLPDLRGNIASPMWLWSQAEQPGRIYFISDHEGVGNLYSVAPDGGDLQRHTDHEDYYARNPSTDGQRIVYHAGADLFLFDPATGESGPVKVDYFSPRVQRNRKFVSTARYLDSAALHPSGMALAITSRGKTFGFYNHEGPVIQVGKLNGVRYRLADWLNDGRRIVVISDESGEERLEIYSGEVNMECTVLADIDFGRAVDLRVCPTGDKVAISNHRHELMVVDLEKQEATLVDRSPYRRIAGFDWSPDGRWLVYGFGVTHQTSELRLYRLAEPDAEEEAHRQAATHTITRPVLHDVRPAFDPRGRYIYFISYREFNPVYDGLHFDLGFPLGAKPYLLTLREDVANPFIPRPDMDDREDDRDDPEEEPEDDEEDEEDLAGEAGGEGDPDEEGDPEGDDDDDDWEEGEWHGRGGRGRFPRLGLDQPAPDEPGEEGQPQADILPDLSSPEDAEKEKIDEGKAKEESKKERKPRRLIIDLEGIERRVLAFPVPEGRYGEIDGIPDKAIFNIFAVQSSLGGEDPEEEEESPSSLLQAYNFREYRLETLAEDADWFDLSRNRKKLVYSHRHRLRVIPAGEKAPHGSGGGPRKSGWIDLGRVKLSIDPQSEWEQMLGEAWRLQRDHFWTEDMSDVDWQIIYQRYLPLIQRVSSRTEFSDLMWEMQGELGTSHAYEFGGDYRPRPVYMQGFLGADATWDEEAGGYRLTNFVHGDPWDSQAHSPLARPGVNVKDGDILIAINGQRLTAETPPDHLLVNQASEEVHLTFLGEQGSGIGERGSGNGERDAERDADETRTTYHEAGDQGSENGERDAERDADETRTTHHEAGDQGSGNGERDAERDADETRTTHHAPRQEESETGNQPARSPVPDPQSPTYKSATIITLPSERAARYRAWVNGNRARVHEATAGKVGYVHIPDMGPGGYAEFHRGYLAEVDKDALIVDVRYNGGGHVSPLILEKLARRRLGFEKQRWGGISPFPAESVGGPIVTLTNEHAGSDGDIFCHSFKMLGLGPLIGKRTWGGVIGIWPRHALVDGTVTTQPEFSFWFQDVGWNVENYGTDPDIEIDNTPQDYREGRDAQLERAVAEILRLLESNPPVQPPDPQSRPSRALPKLPPRGVRG
jgi:tricorn protease